MTVVITALVLGAAVLALRILYENRTFVIKHYKVDAKAGNGAGGWKIVFLSDLHNKEYGEGNVRLVEAIRKVCPDLILVGGDMLIRSTDRKSEEASNFLRQLPSIAPVYCANGNHEQKMKECGWKYGDAYEKYREQLVKAGIHMLENSVETVRINGQEIQIGGVEIPLSFFKKQIWWKHYESFEEKTAEGLMPGQFSQNRYTDGGPYKILMAHQALYAETYARWGMDLILCGHLHGGVVRIPGLGGIISPQLTFFPKYSGEHSRYGDSDIIVSKGLGGHSIPIRLFNRAEVVVIHGKS